MIFKIHFFIYGISLSTIFTYTFVYARYYASVNNFQFGNLAMILPFLTLIAKPVVCSLADSYSSHRKFLAASMGTYMLGFGSMAVLPFFLDLEGHTTDSMAWFFICILIPIGYVSAGVLFSLTDSLASNYARKNNTSYSLLRMWSTIGWGSGALILMAIGDTKILPFRVPGLIILIAVSIIDILIIMLWRNKDDFDMASSESTNEVFSKSTGSDDNNNNESMPPGKLLEMKTHSMVTSNSDNSINIPVESVKENGEKGDGKKKLESLEEQPSNLKVQIILLKLIASKHKSLIRFLVLFVVYGLVQSCIWNFENDFIKNEITKDEKEFEFVSTLCMLAQCVCGEVIIYLLAPKMMEKFGLNANMTLTLVSIGMRCFAYGNFLPYVSIYFVILIEALQGPSFGLFYCVLNEAGMKYSLMVDEFIPKLRKRGIVNDDNEEHIRGCLRATMMGLMGACMEGLGVGMGASIAGWISSKFDYLALWNTGAAVGISAGLVNIALDLLPRLLEKRHGSTDITKTLDVEENNSNNQSPARRSSFPKKMPSDLK